MFVDPVQHHGVPYEAVFLFQHPVVFVWESEEARRDSALLEDVEGGETFATWERARVSWCRVKSGASKP